MVCQLQEILELLMDVLHKLQATLLQLLHVIFLETLFRLQL